jgi:hypothetical protein
MAETQETEQDPVLDALESLSDVATSSAKDLISLDQDLADMQNQRRRGWTWRRIVAASDSPNALSKIAKIATDLGRASGEFRRTLVRGLRHDEAMQVTQIAKLLEVSRQRVSALIHPRRATDSES